MGLPDGWVTSVPGLSRWQAILGRPAPAPRERGKRGGDVLSPRFVEWLPVSSSSFDRPPPLVARVPVASATVGVGRSATALGSIMSPLEPC